MTFEEFAATRMPGVLRFAAVLAGDQATAEDLAQEVLIRAYARWDRIGCLDRPELYVRKMMLNEFLNWRRRSSRQIPVGGMASAPASIAPDHAAEYNEREALLAELGKLPRRQRAVIVLRYYEDRGDSEIADLLGCSPGTVRSHASRALAALRVEHEPKEAGSCRITERATRCEKKTTSAPRCTRSNGRPPTRTGCWPPSAPAPVPPHRPSGRAGGCAGRLSCRAAGRDGSRRWPRRRR